MHELDPFVCDAQTNDICPQVQHLGPGYPREAADSLTRIVENRPLTVAPNLRAFHLKPETRVTDLVSQDYVYTMGLLASPRFCGALEWFRLQAHESYPAEVVHLGRAHAYWYLHFVEELEGRIDYAASEFEIRGRGRAGKAARPTGPDELLRLCRELGDHSDDTLAVRHVEFEPGTPRYDLFCLRLTSHAYFVSDPLAEELARAQLAGLALRPSCARFTFP